MQAQIGAAQQLPLHLFASLQVERSRQRLDSTQMFARVARMSRLDCVRESLRLALQELEKVVGLEARPGFWVGLWERYVESQADYRASAETLGRIAGGSGGRCVAVAGLAAWAGGFGVGAGSAGPVAGAGVRRTV